MSKQKRSEPILCPQCSAVMSEGYIPTVADGIFWFPRDQTPRVNPMAQSLPNTSAWMRYARLHAWRCESCSLVLFKYGRQMEEEGQNEETD